MSLVSVDPTTNKTIRSYPEDSAAELGRKMDAAATAFNGWRRLRSPSAPGTSSRWAGSSPNGSRNLPF